MAKLIVVAAVLVALFAITQVYASRTIITTTVVEEGNPRQSQQERCRQQIQERSQQSFEQESHPCQMHLSQQIQSYDIAMIIDRNPQQQQHLQQCCKELRRIDEECRCQAVQMVVDEQQQRQQERGQRREQQIRQVQQEAEKLPERCNISPQRCQIQTQSS